MAMLAVRHGRLAMPSEMLASAVPLLSRPDLERLVDRLIDRLDELEALTEPEDDDDRAF